MKHPFPIGTKVLVGKDHKEHQYRAVVTASVFNDGLKYQVAYPASDGTMLTGEFWWRKDQVVEDVGQTPVTMKFGRSPLDVGD
jgi:hypothetical protein